VLQAGRAAEARGVIEPALGTAWSTAELHRVASQVYAALGEARPAARERARALRINPSAFD
jgi:Tfp pilus assembly protein PilF